MIVKSSTYDGEVINLWWWGHTLMMVQ